MASAAQNTPDEFEDMVETDQEDAGSGPTPLPTIMLDFGNGKGGAWDDRELIRAYDAAMDEFHAHHPGPGSWLDKATAALKVGEPLPGARATSSKWYAASAKTTPTPSANGTPASQNVQRPAKKQKTSKENTSKQDTSKVNPYAGPSAPTRPRGPSPTYTPPSPAANGDQDEEEYEEEGYDNDEDWQGEEWYDESYALSQHPPQPQPQAQIPAQVPQPPSFGVQDTATTSISDAFSYAMTAQYWAGYWMGVAQAKVHTHTPPAPITASSAAGPSTDRGTTTRPNGTSNILVTRKHFNRPQRPLRR